MRIHTNNPISRYALIMCLSVALLSGQVFNLHMHIQHDESSTSVGHSVDLHAASSLHDTTYNTHHKDDHHSIVIEVSTDSFVKKVGLLNLFILFFFVTGIILCVPRLLFIHRPQLLKIRPASLNFLLHPPLRAPPGNFSV